MAVCPVCGRETQNREVLLAVPGQLTHVWSEAKASATGRCFGVQVPHSVEGMKYCTEHRPDHAAGSIPPDQRASPINPTDHGLPGGTAADRMPAALPCRHALSVCPLRL